MSSMNQVRSTLSMTSNVTWMICNSMYSSTFRLLKVYQLLGLSLR
jgi:hypothetical protein